ncbi:hypothetical protein GGI42DRAFT_282142 [Trichoderma sp. SZMC 28013]
MTCTFPAAMRGFWLTSIWFPVSLVGCVGFIVTTLELLRDSRRGLTVCTLAVPAQLRFGPISMACFNLASSGGWTIALNIAEKLNS